MVDRHNGDVRIRIADLLSIRTVEALSRVVRSSILFLIDTSEQGERSP